MISLKIKIMTFTQAPTQECDVQNIEMPRKQIIFIRILVPCPIDLVNITLKA